MFHLGEKLGLYLRETDWFEPAEKKNGEQVEREKAGVKVDQISVGNVCTRIGDGRSREVGVVNYLPLGLIRM